MTAAVRARMVYFMLLDVYWGLIMAASPACQTPDKGRFSRIATNQLFANSQISAGNFEIRGGSFADPNGRRPPAPDRTVPPRPHCASARSRDSRAGRYAAPRWCRGCRCSGPRCCRCAPPARSSQRMRVRIRSSLVTVSADHSPTGCRALKIVFSAAPVPCFSARQTRRAASCCCPR